MFISPITKQTALSNLTFKGKNKIIGGRLYTPKEIKLAEKYKYASNFEDELMKDIRRESGLFGSILADFYTNTEKTFNEVIKLIKYYKTEHLKKLNLKNDQVTKINKKQNAINIVKEKQETIQFNLLTQKILNQRKENKINILHTQNEKTKYIQNTLENRLLYPLNFDDISSNQKRSAELDKLNGILFQKFPQKEYTETLNWLNKNLKNPIIEIDFGKSSFNKTYTKFLNALNKAKTSNERTLINIENIERFTTPKKSNKVAIGNLKYLLQKCSSEYNCIILANIKKPEIIEPEIMAPQRFGLTLNIEKYLTENQTKFRYIPNGVRMELTANNKFIDLYKGGLGYDSSILWVNSENPDDIMNVMINLDKIKTFPHFIKINKLQYPLDTKSQPLECFKEIDIKTAENKTICEIDLNKLTL